MKGYIKPALILLFLSALTPQAMAESHASNNSDSDTLDTSAHIRLQVIIPEFLSFKVADQAETSDPVSFLSSGAIITDSKDTNISLRGNTGQASIDAENIANTQVTYTAASP